MEKILNATPKYFSLKSKNVKNNDFLYLALLYQYIGCPHECLKCFNDDDLSKKSFNPVYLSLQERKLLIDEAKNMGGKVIIFAGLAEPLTHMHSAPLIKYTAEKDMIPIVYSNGFELDTSMINYLKDNNAVVAMSLDSLDPYKFGIMAKPKSKMYFPDYCKKIIGNIENCIDIYKDTVKYENGVKIVNTAVISTICKINEDEIVKIKNHFGDDTYFICNSLAYEGGAIKNWPILMNNLNPSPEHHMQIIKECSESGGPLTFFNGKCGYSNNGIAVYPDGTYATCAYTSKTNGKIGSAKITTIKDAFLKKHKIESAHYEQFGDCPCLVRSNNFDKYVKSLVEILKCF